eukprot:366395-Chlamydomonas_euryale.AAC.4
MLRATCGALVACWVADELSALQYMVLDPRACQMRCTGSRAGDERCGASYRPLYPTCIIPRAFPRPPPPPPNFPSFNTLPSKRPSSLLRGRMHCGIVRHTCRDLRMLR